MLAPRLTPRTGPPGAGSISLRVDETPPASSGGVFFDLVRVRLPSKSEPPC